MAFTLRGLDRIDATVRNTVEQFSAQVRELSGDNAKALTIFGACVDGVGDAPVHGVQNVLVLDSIDLALLRRLAQKGVTFGKSRIVAPLIMTPSFIEASRDTFALELIEIQQRHVTVFGQDYFDELTFETANVRLQCERELKVAVLSLRHGLLLTTGREAALSSIIERAVENLARTLLGVLWLKGIRKPTTFKEAVAELESVCGKKLSGMSEALNRAVAPTWTTFENLYRDVEAVKQFVDAWK